VRRRERRGGDAPRNILVQNRGTAPLIRMAILVKDLRLAVGVSVWCSG